MQVEFRHLHVFSFSNYNDPDPLWSCVIEKTSGDCWVFADDNFDGLSEEERMLAGANRLEHPRYLRRDKVEDRLGEPARLLLIPIAFQQRLQVVNGRNRVEQLARHVSRGLVRGNAHGLVIVLNDVIDERPVHVLTEHQADGRVLVFTALIVV